MTNFLHETKNVLTYWGKTTNDVQWVGSKDGEFAISWDEFAKIASVEYDSGYGAQKIAQDLVIVGHTWWLERHEYDGSEGWSYKTLPHAQDVTKSFMCVTGGGGWDSLSSLNPTSVPSVVKFSPITIINGFTENEVKIGRKFKDLP